MSMLPTASLGSAGDVPAILNQKVKDRQRALIIIFAGAALMAGASAAVASFQVLAFAAGLYVIILAAWALPLAWLGPVLAALIPFQFYFPVPATSFTMRAAPIFVFAVAVRAAADQSYSSFVIRRSSFVRRFAFLLPATLFILAALIAALGAQDRYAAFKGIYDWLVVLLTAFTAAALAPSATTARRTLSVLIIGGVAQALLGLVQYVLGLNTILDLLRLPVSELLYQPNLLKDRLGDLSFNWVAFERALPFGTFINGIDYAVYLAAVLCLIIALVIARDPPSAGRLSLRIAPHPERSPLHLRAESKERAQSKVADPATPSGERRDEAIPNIAEDYFVPAALANAQPLLASIDDRQTEPSPPSAVGGPRSSVAIAGPGSTLALVLCAISIAVALLLTFKGSGFLALIGGMAAIALFALPRLSKTTAVVGLIVLVGALVVALPFADLIGQRAVYLLQREQGSAGSVGRLQTWSSLLQFVVQRPLFGYGLNNAIPLIEPQWTLRDGAPGFVFSTPESAYVSALVETGLVGLVALIGWLSAAVVDGYRRATAKYGSLYLGMVAALVALAFGNLTVSGLTTDQNGMLLGMLIGLIYGSQKND